MEIFDNGYLYSLNSYYMHNEHLYIIPFLLCNSLKNVLSPPKQPYRPKSTNINHPKSTSAHLCTLLPSFHTNPSWYMRSVTTQPRYMPLFFPRAPFRSDAATCRLSHSILLYGALWCLSLITAALSLSDPLCDIWRHSVPPMLLCTSPCWSFCICADLCRSATPKSVPIILKN